MWQGPVGGLWGLRLAPSPQQVRKGVLSAAVKNLILPTAV